MSLVEWLAHPAGRVLTMSLVHFLWQGAAVSAALVLVVELCGVRRPATRYACSLAALFAMILCPLISLTWLGLSAADSPRPPATVAIQESAIAMSLAQWPQLETLQPAALALWLAGVSVFGGRLLIGAFGLARLRHSRQPLPREIAAIVERLGKRLALDARGLVYLSRHVADAMAVGVVRPLVLIPAAWITEMPPQMLEAAIAHELAHLARRDLLVNLLQRIVETLLFYHPAVWWLSRRLRIERELCADELAVFATGRRLEYAQALEHIAQRRRAEVGPLLAAFLRGEKNMRLLERVRNVLGQATDERSRQWPAGLVALALPLLLWSASIGLPAAVADEQEPDGVKRRVQVRLILDKDGKELQEVLVHGEEPKKPGPRDGDAPKKPGAHEGATPKKTTVKEPKFTEDQIERVIRFRDGERIAQFDQLKGDGEDRRLEELTALVKRLASQVERLQAEVSSLRGEKGGEEVRDEAIRAIKRKLPPPAEEGSEADAVERKLRQADEQKEQTYRRKFEAELKARAAEIRKRDEARQEREGQLQERKIENKPNLEREAVLKEHTLHLKNLDDLKAAGVDIEAFVKQARAGTERAAAQARQQGEHHAAQARDAERQAGEAKERAAEAKERAAAIKEEAQRAAAEKKERAKEDGQREDR